MSFQSGTAGGNIFSWYTVDDANDLYYSSVAIGPDANPGVLSRAGITNREGELIVDFDPRVLNHFVGQNDCTENITMSIVPLTKDEDGSASMLSIVRTSYLSCENSHGQICTIEYSGVIEK